MTGSATNTKRITSRDQFETTQHIWYGHVQSISDKLWPKTYTFNIRKRRRMISWKNRFEKIMTDRAIEVVELTNR